VLDGAVEVAAVDDPGAGVATGPEDGVDLLAHYGE
jgi:hypothetical protein